MIPTETMATDAPAFTPDLAAVLRVIDSCGGIFNFADHGEYTRGYNDALDACEREMKRAWGRIVAGEVQS